MGWLVSFVVGAAAEALALTVFHYLFALSEADGVANYRSRLDWALAEGERPRRRKPRLALGAEGGQATQTPGPAGVD